VTRISTIRKQFRAALIVFSALACVLYASVPAGARPWKPTPQGLAQDYGEIVDGRSQGEIVVLFWFVPQMVAESPAAKAMLDKYVVIGVVHARPGPGGSMLFDAIDTLQAKDADGKPLTLLEGDKLPADASGFVTAMGGTMKQALGAMGQGMRIFVFDNGGVHSCTKGGLLIPYDGEVYTYNTPIPGCPAN
jgi:hypothetical protein